MNCMNYALSVGTALLAGLLLTRLGNKFRLPDVTSYLIAGLLLGPCCIGLLKILALAFIRSGCRSPSTV